MDMKVAAEYYEPADDDEVDLLFEHATFTHKEHGEVVYYLPDKLGDSGDFLFVEKLSKSGLPKPAIDLFKEAAAGGYKYICLYWG